MTTDQRRYRRILWAYPGHYRRRHGSEIVTTLLEMEEAGGRVTTGHALHLIGCGIRQRFRVPRRPLALIAAVLAAVALGGLGAAAGTWLGWQTAATVPSTARASALASAAAGLPWPSVERWRTAMGGPGVNAAVSGTGNYDAERLRTALLADGWRITSFTEADRAIMVNMLTPRQEMIPMRDLTVTATRDGLSLYGALDVVEGGAKYGVDGQTSLGLDITADVNGAIRPLTVAGLLIGALGGWLVAAALAYRLRRHGRWTAPILAAVALAGAAVPAFVGYCKTYQVMIYDTHASNQYVTESPSDRIPQALILIGAVVAVVAVVALLPFGRRRIPEPA